MRKSYLLHFLLIICLAIGGTEKAVAVKANPNPVTITQPDGSTLTIRIHGDENLHYTTTIDGYLIRRDNDGYFKYVDMDADGSLRITSQTANNIDNRDSEEQQTVSRLVPAKKLQAQLTKSHSGIAKKPGKVLGRHIVSPSLPAGENAAESQYLVILVNFKDCTFHFAQNDFDLWLNEPGYDVDGGTGSVKDYYRDNSMGKFIPNFTVVGPYTLAHEQSYYAANADDGSGDINPRAMVIEACNLAKENNPQIDFSIFDNDKDGYMDNVNIIYAGYSEASTGDENDMWPHSWTLGEEAITIDGITINNYGCSAELVGASGIKMDGIGTFTHEFGHILGLKDLYDTDDYLNGYGLDPGAYTLYASGSYNNDSRTPPYLTAFERMQMGWCDPIELSEPEDVALQPIYTNEARYINAQPGREEGTGFEWFVLENRQREGWDTYLPAHGLLIYHYDYTQEMVEEYWSVNGPNNNSKHRCLYIKPADGIDDTNTRNGDTYPGRSGNTEFTDTSTPNSLNWAGEATNTPVTNIREEGGIIYFQVKGGVSAQSILKTLTPQNIRDTSVEAQAVVVNKTQSIREMGFCWATQEEPTIDSYRHTVEIADTISYIITGLETGTQYNVRAYMILEDNSVIYGAAIPFSTECQVAVAPYIADFTSWTDGEPDCWKIVDNNKDGTTWIFDENADGMLYQFDYWNNADDWLISTRMLVPENGCLYFVRGVVETTTVENLDIYVSTHSREIEDFHLVKRYSFADNFGVQVPEEIDLKEYEGQEIYIAFVCHSEKLQGSLWLWQIYLASKLDTPRITKFESTDNGLYLEWTPIENAVRYYLEFSEVTDEVYTNAVFVPVSDLYVTDGNADISTGTIFFSENGVVETRDYPDGIIDCMFIVTTSGPTGTSLLTIEGTLDGTTWEQIGPSIRKSAYDNEGSEHLLSSYLQNKLYRKLRITCQHGGRNLKIKYFTLQYNDGYVCNMLSEGYVENSFVNIIETTPDEFLSGKKYAATVYSGDGVLFYDASETAYFSAPDNVSLHAVDKAFAVVENGNVCIRNLAQHTRVLCSTADGVLLYNNIVDGNECSFGVGEYQGVLIIRLIHNEEGRIIKLVVNP